MSTSIKLSLSKKRERADKTYPIVFNITHNRKQTTIATSYSVIEKEWDDEALRIKNKSRYKLKTGQINNILKNTELGYGTTIVNLETKGKLNTLSLKQLLDKLKSIKSSKTTFETFTTSIIKDLRYSGRIGTADSYQSTLNFFLRYSSDLLFADITPTLLTKFEILYMGKPNHHYNGLAVYMRTIRAIYNKAIADEIIDSNLYPFRKTPSDKRKYNIKKEKTRKRAIPIEHIAKIENYEHAKYDAMGKVNARLYFLFSFYMRGVNYVDMAHFKKLNIINGKLNFKRSKTGRLFEIKINPKAQAILDYFELANKKQNNFLFPIIKRPFDKELTHNDIRQSLKNTNKHLKTIAKDVGISTTLTTYVSRHSWATIADKAGVDRKIISKGLGHSDLATTEIYIDDLVSNTDLEDADDIIIGI